MAFTDSEKKQVDWILQNFWQRNRPPERARHLYEPYPEAADFETVLQVVEEDSYGCFWG